LRRPFCRSLPSRPPRRLAAAPTTAPIRGRPGSTGTACARAWGAHLNGFEAFPFFAVAVLLSEMRHAPQGMIDALAAGYVAVRLGYMAAYLGDRPALRSALWALGLLLNIALMVLPALAAR